MRALLTLLLLLCAVVSLAAPVSADDYFFYKDVNATELTTALVDYCNGNIIQNTSGYDLDIGDYNIKICDVRRLDDTLEFRLKCTGFYWVFVFIPLPIGYDFEGVMHVDNPQVGLKKPYKLSILCNDKMFRATGENWKLEARDTTYVRFKS